MAAEFPSKTPADRQAAVPVDVLDYGDLHRFSFTPILGYVDSDGVHLTTTQFRTTVSGDVLVPWTSIDACGQTIWCPGRDTNLWLDDLGMEIRFEDDNREYLAACGDNGVLVLTSGIYSAVKHGEMSLESARDTEPPELSATGCSDNSSS